MDSSGAYTETKGSKDDGDGRKVPDRRGDRGWCRRCCWRGGGRTEEVRSKDDQSLLDPYSGRQNFSGLWGDRGPISDTHGDTTRSRKHGSPTRYVVWGWVDHWRDPWTTYRRTSYGRSPTSDLL